MKNTSANKTSPANTSSINTSSKEFEKESDQSRTSLTDLYASFGICREVLAFAEPVLDGLRRRFAAIDETAEYNQLRVIRAMQECHIGEAHLKGTTGYGYDDIGRDGLEKVYASYFGTEDALVRPQITCGTHALALALMGNLRPGDILLSAAGKPYDTLEEVIGIRPSRGSLAEYGIGYRQVDLLPDGIGGAISFIKSLRPDILCMTDNCYGEFVERIEPSHVGADMVVGSLIKNPGGGLAPVGGYIAGRADCVENAAVRLTSPGLGKEVGPSLEVLPSLYQGFFMGPTVTAAALKGAIFAACLYEKLGFSVLPDGRESRHDIIQSITFGNPEGVIAFCQGIQSSSPVDSFVEAYPAPMPGYDSDVIMAAGAFVSGSSIELSADGPIKPPYAVYFQGGLTWPHARLGILRTVQNFLDRGLISLP